MVLNVPYNASSLSHSRPVAHTQQRQRKIAASRQLSKNARSMACTGEGCYVLALHKGRYADVHGHVYLTQTCRRSYTWPIILNDVDLHCGPSYTWSIRLNYVGLHCGRSYMRSIRLDYVDLHCIVPVAFSRAFINQVTAYRMYALAWSRPATAPMYTWRVQYADMHCRS